jgi:hypothetical protein
MHACTLVAETLIHACKGVNEGKGIIIKTLLTYEGPTTRLRDGAGKGTGWINQYKPCYKRYLNLNILLWKRRNLPFMSTQTFPSEQNDDIPNNAFNRNINFVSFRCYISS